MGSVCWIMDETSDLSKSVGAERPCLRGAMSPCAVVGAHPGFATEVLPVEATHSRASGEGGGGQGVRHCEWFYSELK